MDTRDNLVAWRLLQRLAKLGNLTRVAIEENVELSAASRMLRDLERDLGVPLLNRETRPLKVRQEVRDVLPLLTNVLDGAVHLVHQLEALSEKAPAERPFRISIPANIPRRRVLSVIADFLKETPEWKVEVTGTCDHIDVLEKRVDAAYLPYIPIDEELKVQVFAPVTTLMVATPAYLRAFGVPKSVGDLGRHTMVLRSGAFYPVTDRLVGPRSVFTFNTGIETPLPFEQWLEFVEPVRQDAYGKEREDLPNTVRRHLPVVNTFTGDTLSCLQAVLDGRGIAADLSIGSLEPYLMSGELVAVLPDWHRPLWHPSLVSLASLWSEPIVAKFLTHFVKREQHDSQVWKRVFKRYGIDADAIEGRNI